MKNRIKILSVAVLFTVLALAACGFGNYARNKEAYIDYNSEAGYKSGAAAKAVVEETAAASYDSHEVGVADMAGNNAPTEVNYAGSGDYKQKLIKTVDLNVATKEYDKSTTELNNYIKKNNSYVEYSNTYNPQGSNSYQGDTRSASYTIRVPQESLDALVTDLETLGTVTSKTENVQDISLEYSDIEAHKKALQIEEESLLNLLAKAESMDAIIALQSRLSEIRYEKESYESSLRLYDNQVQYSTVSLYLTEVKEYDTLSENSYWGKFQKSFASSMAGAGYFFGEVFIIIFASLPYIIPIALVVAIICFIIIKISNKNKAKLIKVKKTGIKDKTKETEENKEIKATEPAEQEVKTDKEEKLK